MKLKPLRQLLLLPLLIVSSCSGMSDFKKHQRFIEQQVINNPAIAHHSLTTDGLPLHYATAGKPTAGIVVLIHGTPGSWADFGALLLNAELTSELLLVSIDRPGWGDSQLRASSEAEPRVYPGFKDQLHYIQPVIHHLQEVYPRQPIYLLGHSWGASLALAMAIERPRDYEGLLLFAGGLSPKLMQPRWYHHLAGVWPVSALIGEGFRKSNKEMFALAPSLQMIDSNWHRLSKMSVIVAQGGRDSLVPAANADYAESRLNRPALDNTSQSGALVIIDPDYGHLWHIQRPEILAACILAMAKESLQDCANQINLL